MKRMLALTVLAVCLCAAKPASAVNQFTIASAACSDHSTCAPPVSIPAAPCTATAAAEVVPVNATANHTVGDGIYTWGNEVDPVYWHEWGVLRPMAQGAVTGTTDELLQHYSCRWGFKANLLRAVADQESTWVQSEVGDVCGPVGEASYSIIQIKNAYCSGALAWGGYPDTQSSTPLALDFYGANLRACFDGAFYDGGTWLYGGKTVAQVAAQHSWQYVLWGCVGAWFSGGWYDSGATTYINSVKAHLAAKDWP